MSKFDKSGHVVSFNIAAPVTAVRHWSYVTWKYTVPQN